MKILNIINIQFPTFLLFSLLSIYHHPTRTNPQPAQISHAQTASNAEKVKGELTTLVLILESAVEQKDMFQQSDIAATQSALKKARPYLTAENVDAKTLEKVIYDLINASKPILEQLTQNVDQSDSSQAAQASPVNIVDDTISQAQKMLNQLSSVLTDLSTMINNGQINSLQNKSEALHNIGQCIEIIQSVAHEKFPEASPLIAFNILEINETLNKHIQTAIKSGFKQFPAFDLQSIMVKKSKREEITTGILQEKIKINVHINSSLTKNFDQVGLTAWNKKYRKIDKYIITPCLNNSRNIVGLSSIAALGVYGYGILGGFENKPWATSFKSWFGSPNVILDQYAPTPPDSFMTFAQGERMASKLLMGNLFFGGVLLASSNDFVKKQWSKHWSKWSTELSIWHNTQKGGAFINKANKLNKHFTGSAGFDDVIGLETMKSKFTELIQYIQNPETFDRLGITPPKGYLLAGESRTGKTFIVSALANELKKSMKANGNDKDAEIKFFPFHSAEVTELGGIKYIMGLAKYAAPCILFIDEIDLLALQRCGANATLSEFLVSLSGAMDEVDPKNQVIVIAATNQPESLDFALTNYGRLGKPIFFDLPTLSQRKELLTRKIKKLCLNPANFDIDQLARETDSWSYAKLDTMVKGALIASRVRGDVLTQQYLENSLNQLRGVTPKPARLVSKEEIELLATHFAGNALALQLLDTKIRMSNVTLEDVAKDVGEKVMGSHLWEQNNTQAQQPQQQRKKDDFDHGAVFVYSQYDSLSIMSYKDKMNLCKYYLAGIAAEELLFGHASYSCHPQAKKYASSIATSLAFEGIDPQQLPTEMQVERYKKAQAIMDNCKQEIRALLEQHITTLKAIIAALIEKKTLKQSDIEAIIASVEGSKVKGVIATA